MKFQYFFLSVTSIIAAIPSSKPARAKDSSPLEKHTTYALANLTRALPFEGKLFWQNKYSKTSNFSPKQQGLSRQRRSENEPLVCSNLTSCTGRCAEKRMFHNIKEKKEYPACYCDPECDQVFSDCCADFVEKCGTPKRIRAKKINKHWNCFWIKDYPIKIWMISGCRTDWPRKDSNVLNCADFSAIRPNTSSIVPVYAGKTTYRNKYCALCNGVTKFKSWKFSISCKAPKRSTKNEKMDHYDKYCDGSSVKFTQTRSIRYCYQVVDSCTNFIDIVAYKNCMNGITGLLSYYGMTYRNRGCFLCNGNSNDMQATCGPNSELEVILGEHVKSLDDPLITILFVPEFDPPLRVPGVPECPLNQIYDNEAKFCRKLFVYNTTTSFLKQSTFRLSFELRTNNSCLIQHNRNTSTHIQQHFVKALQEKFDIYSQNTSTQLHDLDAYISENDTKSLVTFQVLTARSANETINASFVMEKLGIEEIDVRFFCSGNITVRSFVLRKVESRDAVCLDNETYPVNIEDVETENGSIYLNVTKKEYDSGEYLLYRHENETRIALCRDRKPEPCLYHLSVRNRTHWQEFTNRSIYSMVTKSWFHYGDYSLVNGTLWLCITKDYTRQTYKLLAKQTSIHDTILSYGNIVSFSISIGGLSLLLLVYSIFPELRNLPGKNLMLFSAILALAQTSWLLQNKLTSQWPSLCPTINATMQYLLLASFTCSLSIAIQSFLTFNALAKGKLRQRSNDRTFLKYSFFALGLPFLFVATCLILDTNNMVPFNYGGSTGHCWFGETSILYIAFLYPAFFLLFCSMSLFFATLRVIYRCTKASKRLAEKTGGPNKRHVGIYLRMSSVMGFTWLAGVFIILFPNEIAFQYIFVFVNGFQGLYLSFAFLSTANVRKIVCGKAERPSSVPSTRYSTATSPAPTSIIEREATAKL